MQVDKDTPEYRQGYADGQADYSNPSHKARMETLGRSVEYHTRMIADLGVGGAGGAQGERRKSADRRLTYLRGYMQAYLDRLDGDPGV